MNYNRNQNIEPSSQNAFTNLDQDVHKSRHTKYKNKEEELTQWIFKVLNFLSSDIQAYKDHNQDLMDILKSGMILCQLGNLLEVPNNPCKKMKNSKMPFVQMENITFFMKLCELIGLPQDEIFQTVDLYDRRDPYQVVIAITSFSRYAHKIDPSKFPEIIGPQVAKIKPAVPNKPINLRHNG